MKIRVIDTISVNGFHEQFNAAFLLQCLNQLGHVEYFSSDSSFFSIKKLLPNRYQSFASRDVFVIKNDSTGAARFFKLVISALLNSWYLIVADRSTTTVYNYNNIFFIPLLSLITRMMKKRVVVICHGELELLSELNDIENSKRKYKLFGRIFLAILSKFFCAKRDLFKGVTFVVLGDVIMNNVQKCISPHLIKRFKSIDHPFPINAHQKENANDCETINIGVLGAINGPKNGNNLLRMLSLNLITNTKVKFHIVGNPGDFRVPFTAAGVVLPDGDKKLLERETYDKLVSNLDYVMFLYECNYKFTASGALFDAIQFGIPVFGLKNEYFLYLSKKFDVPYACFDDLNRVAEYINSLDVKPVKYFGRPILDSINSCCDIAAVVNSIQ